MSKNISEFTESDYSDLKEYFKQSTNLKNADFQKCTNYFAAWWKFEYVDGKPSKEIVYNSIGIQNNYFTYEDFYKCAKEGGKQIGLKWIRNENTLYFRTLLLQGRIPLKSLKRYNTYWRKFLLKVIEKIPSDIEDIANDHEIISLLPISTRNEGVYESALEISKAIWDESDEGKKLLEILEQNDQKELVNSLKKEKEKIRTEKQAQIKLKAFWELKISAQNNASITMRLDLPNKLHKEAFSNLIKTETNELSNTYNLFCDDYLLATYKKNLNGDYLKYATSTQSLIWNSEMEQIPLFYFVNNEGNKHFVSNLIKCMPSLKLFTFWVQMDDSRWMMLSKNNFNGEKAFILANELELSYSNYQSFFIEENSISLYEINKNNITELNKTSGIDFTFSDSTYDWSITTNMPTWINNANMLVVQNFPKIYFYDEDNEIIAESKVKIHWRKRGDEMWKETKFIPIGIIELRFCYNEVKEYDKIYNVGDFKLQFKLINALTASLSFKHDNLDLTIIQNDLFNIDTKIDNKIILNYTNSNQIPKRIKGVINGQNGNLIVDIIAPTIGIDIVDSKDKILENNHEFILNNLFGYRIVCGENQTIKFYNQKLNEIVIRQKINAGLIPLRNFHNIIQKLFLLSDAMDSKNKVVMEIFGKTFYFQIYNSRLRYKNYDNLLNYSIDNRLLIQVVKNEEDSLTEIDADFRLYAIPLNCDLSNIEVIEMEKLEANYSFPIIVKDTEFIVFDNEKDITCKILPTYVSTIQENLIAPLEYSIMKERKEKRINDFAISLNSSNISDSEWQKLIKYIKVCIQYHLPFSAFDNIRSSCSTSELTAKLFFCILIHAETHDEFIKTCEKMEEELGFKFHWCSFKSFVTAVNWIYEIWNNINIADILDRAKLVLESKYLNLDKKDWKCNPHLNTEINSMRARLGETIINELPQKRPWLKELRKHVIPFPNEIPKLKIMARCPIAIGLTKLDMYSKDLNETEGKHDIWNLNNHEVRRNIIYCQQIDPEWYDLALKYTIFNYTK